MIVVAALAVVVLLQNRQVSLAACHGGAQPLDILRPQLVDDRLARIAQHEFVPAFVPLVPRAVIRVIDEFLQELHRLDPSAPDSVRLPLPHRPPLVPQPLLRRPRQPPRFPPPIAAA